MINLQTLLSTFDKKGTLLKWLKKVEQALNNATLSSVEVITVDETHIKLKFIFEDDTYVLSPSLALPRGLQGPQGEQGEQGPQGPQGPQGEAGVVTIASLIALLEGSDYISVDLNQAETKVVVELDETKLDDEPTEDSDNLVKSSGVFDALAGKLNASKQAVATVGGLVSPTAVLANNELVGVGVNGEQVRVQLGEGLTLEGSTSPYTLKASGGGGGTQLYKHTIECAGNYIIILISSSGNQIFSFDFIGEDDVINVYYYVTQGSDPIVQTNDICNIINISRARHETIFYYFNSSSGNIASFTLVNTDVENDTVTPL